MTSFKDEILDASKGLEISHIADLAVNLIDEIKLAKVEKYVLCGF